MKIGQLWLSAFPISGFTHRDRRVTPQSQHNEHLHHGEKKASPSTHVSYSVLQATGRFYPSFPIHSRGWNRPTIWQQPSSRHRRVLLGAEQIGQQSFQQRIRIWGPPDSTRKQSFPGWPSVFLGCPLPHGSHPILPYLKDGVGVVIGLYVIQAHNTWQVSGAIICPGQLGLLVQVSDLLLCESGLQHILQNKRKFQIVLGQSIELTGHICNSNFYQKQKILCHEQPPKGFPTVGLRMEVTWNGPTAHCSSIKRWLSKTQNHWVPGLPSESMSGQPHNKQQWETAGYSSLQAAGVWVPGRSSRRVSTWADA